MVSRRGYTKKDVTELANDTQRIAETVHEPFAARRWKRLDPDVLDEILYDALVALYNEMTMEDD